MAERPSVPMPAPLARRRKSRFVGLRRRSCRCGGSDGQRRGSRLEGRQGRCHTVLRFTESAFPMNAEILERLEIPSLPGSEPRYFRAMHVSLYIVANRARFWAWVRVALKMRVSFSLRVPERKRNIMLEILSNSCSEIYGEEVRRTQGHVETGLWRRTQRHCGLL